MSIRDVVKADGLVIAFTRDDGKVYPLACAKDTSITITRDMIELAPKSNNYFRRFIPGKRTFTVSGSGLVKLVYQGAQLGLDYFDDMFTTTNTNFVAYLDMISPYPDYKVYQFNCYISELTLDSVVNGFASYSYTLQGNGAFTEITEVDSTIVGSGTSGLISARNYDDWQLVAVGYEGKWYYQYNVLLIEGNYYIDIGSALNGTKVRTVYIPI
jgi:hypothetical protein